MRRIAIRKAALLAAALGATALPAQEAAEEATRRSADIPQAECLPGEDGDADAAAAPAEPRPVLIDGLGYAGIEADTANAEAQAWFAQGVRFVWAFDEVEAVRAFREAQRLDPECAMCFWGEAWARGPTVNLVPRTEELADARAAARKAVERAGRLGERDRLLVRAMEIRNAEGDAFDDAGYAAFLEAAALRMPGDDMLAVMAAAARMQVDYEMRPGSLAQRLLERVLARNPDHGGAIHFYIHLTDWIDRQELAEPHADRLGRIAPAASHLVHMPAHTYYGVGRYGDAAGVNVAAIAADARYEQAVRPPASNYRRMLLRHNMQFAINSALARGDGRTALAVGEQYRAEFLTGSEVQQASRFLGSAVYYAQGLHGDVDRVLDLPEPADGNALSRLTRLYARGEALARRGDAGAVRAEAEAIAALASGADAPALGRAGGALAEVYRHVLEGRAAMLLGDHDGAASAYRRAMERQLAARFGSDPPLFWYSVRRSLAAALLAGGDAEGARRQLHASLRRWRQDPLALYALSLADRQLGDTASADRNLARARRVWAGDVTQVPLSRI